ncbi:MAG: isopentenyl-diphosphate Delta-isomerase [Bacteroidota bacterium]|nr:isopentenyl-diphosphate Delta-isomerase [Bacteroidota bacterium]
MREEEVILVDKNDNPLGMIGKMEAHKKGLLHRAFSVFILNTKHELLIQKRAFTKYHSAGLWANTCCSHQRKGESSIQAGRRRLFEEMGFNTSLEELFSFVYKTSFDNGLIEHEFDHVLLGFSNDKPKTNPSEVDDFKWVNLEILSNDLKLHPEKYTVWFLIIFDRFYKFVTDKKFKGIKKENL